MHHRIGLISDTHTPQRLAALPPAVFDALAGVDMVLHAGDVGELWVLDHLSRIAPVIAVHGNDDTADAQRQLPYRQVVTVAGTRILLTHAHHPDRAEEMASRTDDTWGPKLARRAAMGKDAGAAIVVYGHTHIPTAVEQDGVLLVNPGALGPPNLITRQSVRSVAVLTIRDAAPLSVHHISLDAPDAHFAFPIDWNGGFRAALDRVQEPIVTPEVAALMPRLYGVMERDTSRTAIAAYTRLARSYWSGERVMIAVPELRAAIHDASDIPSHVRHAMLAALDAPADSAV